MSRRQARRLPATLPRLVATDGSARGDYAGWANLSDVGGWTVHAREFSFHASNVALHAELYAMALTERQYLHAFTMLSDSQSAVDLVTDWINGKRTPIPGYEGRHLVDFARRVGSRKNPLTVQWVRSHDGHPLNEGADALARLGSRAIRDGLSKDELAERAAGIAAAFTGGGAMRGAR